jgi:putative oxidoreductase
MQCPAVVKDHLPRVLLSLVFIVGGFGFVQNFSATVGFVGKGIATFGLPMSMAAIALVIAIILKLGGGLMLLANFKTRAAAWMLVAFTVLATIMYHMNWSGDAGQNQMTQFLKNLAIIGGLLYVTLGCPSCERKQGDAPTA